MANKITIDGIDYEIDLDNLASEATLKAFAESMVEKEGIAQKFQEKLEKAQKELANVIEENAEESEGLLEKLLRASQDAGNQSGGGLFSNLFKNIGNLGKAIPLLGSILGGLIGAIVGVVQGLWGEARKLADIVSTLVKTGTMYVGSMTQLIFYASEAGLALSELVGLTTKNMILISRIGGGDMSKGLRTFTQAITAAHRGAEGASDGLAGLGYTTEETGELMLAYLDNMDRINTRSILDGLSQTQRQQTLEKGVKNFASELFALSRATGKTREELLGTFNDIASDTEFLLTTAGNQNSQAIQKVGVFLKSMSEDLYESFVSVLRYDSMTGAVENNVAMTQLLGSKVAGEFTRITKELEAGTLDPDAAQDQLTSLFGDPAVSQTLRNQLSRLSAEFTKNPAVKSVISMVEGFRKVTQNQQEALRTWVSDNAGMLEGLSDEEKKAKYEEFEKEQRAANQQIARSVRLFDSMMNRIGNAFAGIFIEIMDNEGFHNAIESFTKLMENVFKSITTRLGPILSNSSLSLGEKIVKVFGVFFDEFKTQIWPAIAPAWKDFVKSLKFGLLMLKADILDAIPTLDGDEEREEAYKYKFEQEGMGTLDASRRAQQAAAAYKAMSKAQKEVDDRTKEILRLERASFSSSPKDQQRNLEDIEQEKKRLNDAESELAKRKREYDAAISISTSLSSSSNSSTINPAQTLAALSTTNGINAASTSSVGLQPSSVDNFLTPGEKNVLDNIQQTIDTIDIKSTEKDESEKAQGILNRLAEMLQTKTMADAEVIKLLQSLVEEIVRVRQQLPSVE